VKLLGLFWEAPGPFREDSGGILASGKLLGSFREPFWEASGKLCRHFLRGLKAFGRLPEASHKLKRTISSSNFEVLNSKFIS
jgi:hypothetical protein